VTATVRKQNRIDAPFAAQGIHPRCLAQELMITGDPGNLV
jgi:hypothetical protein